MLEQNQEYHFADRRFGQLINTNQRVQKLYTGCCWAEGPVYFRDGNFLLWSDIPNDRILRFVPDLSGQGGQVSVYRQPANYTNGHTRDHDGRLLSCEHGGRRVTRTNHDGKITVVADHFDGKRLNSPNDIVVKNDGTIWFTDPPYGHHSDLEGELGASELGKNYVFCFDPRDASLRVVVDDMTNPNGLAFSPDERELYVADTGRSFDPEGPQHIRIFSVTEDNKLTDGDVFASPEVGACDGLRVDIEGNVWSSAGDGVYVYAPSGDFLGKIAIPEVVANLTFGGPKRNRLYICGTTSLYSVLVQANGAQRP